MLEAKEIAVFGAGGLLGSALVNGLLDAGVRVVASDIRLDGMQHAFDARIAAGAPLSLRVLDIANKSALTAFLAEHTELDGAVNCSYPRNKAYGAHFFDVTLDSFNENLSLHLGSHFQLMQACAAQFVASKHPFSLVNISSVYGVISPRFEIYQNTPMTMPVEYAAIKSALIHLSKYVVTYVADSDFRVNCLSPGGLLDDQPREFLAAYESHTLGTGMLTPKDMVGTIMFLLSENSKFINGQNIIVDDGFCL